MLNIRKLTTVVVIVLALTMVGTTLAAPQGAGKALLYERPGGDGDPDGFTCSEGAANPGGPTFGFVVLNTNGKPGTDKDLIVQVSLKGATPNATYDIWINQDPGACPLLTPTAPGALTTNAQGNGNAHVQVPRGSGASNFWVSAVGGGQVLRSTAVPLD